MRRKTFGLFILAFAFLTGPARAETFCVGAAKASLDPADVSPPVPIGDIFLGGFGLGSVRPAEAVDLDGYFVTAFVVASTNKSSALAFVSNDTQGSFTAYKRGPWGLRDIARKIEAETGGVIPRGHVIVSSDHSHAGADTTGVWGGLPDAYMEFFRDQHVAAVKTALDGCSPAVLSVGATDTRQEFERGGGLLNSQFDEPPNARVDDELRVLVARNPTTSDIQAMMINFAAHATVMGSGNRILSPDWPGPVRKLARQEWGVDPAVVMVGSNGRTQPRDRGCPDPNAANQQLCANEEYGARVFEAVQAAVTNSETRPVQGSELGGATLFIRVPAHNAALLVLNSVGGAPCLVEPRDNEACAPISRAITPPWLTGNVIGTWVSVARVGDVFFGGSPGEAYPDVHFAAEERVRSAQDHFTFGLANDQLGYLVAPIEGYGQVAVGGTPGDAEGVDPHRELDQAIRDLNEQLGTDVPPPGRPLTQTRDNDNFLFNVAPEIGEQVKCTMLKGARRLGFGNAPLSDPPQCATWLAEPNDLPEEDAIEGIRETLPPPPIP